MYQKRREVRFLDFFSSKPLGATQCVQIMRDKNRDEGDGKVCHALYRHGGRSKDSGGKGEGGGDGQWSGNRRSFK